MREEQGSGMHCEDLTVVEVRSWGRLLLVKSSHRLSVDWVVDGLMIAAVVEDRSSILDWMVLLTYAVMIVDRLRCEQVLANGRMGGLAE